MFELMAQVLVAAAAVGIAAFGLRFFAVKLQNALLGPQKKITRDTSGQNLADHLAWSKHM